MADTEREIMEGLASEDAEQEKMDKQRTDVLEEERIKDLTDRYFLSPELIEEQTSYFPIERQTFNEGLEEILLADRKQDIDFKRKIFKTLKWFMIIETGVIFLFAMLQAVENVDMLFFRFRFHLDEWTFRLIVGATISQITFMFHIIVKNLFPGRKDRAEI